MQNGIKDRRLRGVALAAVAALVVAACGGAAATPAPTAAPTAAPTNGATAAPVDPLAEVCAAGAQEGRLVHWHNHSDDFAKAVEAFNEVYPGIQVELLELSPDEAAQRILTEVAAGRTPSADLLAGGIDIFKPLFDRGAIATDIDWAELGVPEDVVKQGVVRIHRIAIGLGYNTDKFSAADLPNTWEELIDAKWAGRVIVDPRGRPFDSLGLVWGQEDTVDYLTRLRDVVRPLVIEGGTAGLVAVAGGEADITTGGRSAETLEQQAKGAPVDIKYLDIVTTIDNYKSVLKDAAHPNAAICFTAWFAQDGQAIYNEIEFKTNETVPTGAPAGATIVTIETPEESDLVRAIGRELRGIFTGG